MFTKKLLYTVVSMLAVIGSLRAQNEGYSVGTPQGSLSVSEMGAAVYNLNIEVPNGGPLTPQIGIAYNSQMSGYGLVGYGMNITGISCITRGGKDLFHDKVYKGVSYSESDNYYLDGKRLIREEGVGYDGTKYSLEGDPFTKITLHFKAHQEQYEIVPGYWEIRPRDEDNEEWIDPIIGNKDVIDEFWFEVITKDGSVFQYGNTDNSKLTISYDNTECISSWSINRAEDRFGNFIIYQYNNSNYFTKPIAITYGYNSRESRGLINKIAFEYQSLGNNSRPFMIKDKQGMTDSCLSSITTTSNNQVYRKYSFTYDSTSDLTPGKWNRLVSITESNGLGEKYHPVSLEWNHLSSGITASQLNFDPQKNDRFTTVEKRTLISGDINGDGIDDIIQFNKVSVIGEYNDNMRHYYTYLIISKSKKYNDGTIAYESYPELRFPTTFSSQYLWQFCSSNSISDIDGDGINDFVITFNESVHNTNSGQGYDYYYVFLGRDFSDDSKRGLKYHFFQRPTNNRSAVSFMNNIDIDGDGKNEIISLEDKPKNNKIVGHIAKFDKLIGDSLIVTHSNFEIKLNEDLKRFFVGDYNNDGLADLMILTDTKCKIVYNNGGTQVSQIFSENNTLTTWSLCDHTRIVPLDYDGDGDIDYLYAKENDASLYLAKNNGTDFKNEKLPIKIAEGQQSFTSLDDESYSIVVCDVNHDGYPDALISKSDYDHSGFGSWSTKYHYTKTYWILSDGKTLSKYLEYDGNETDSREGTIFTGDFDGDGYAEIANYGNILNTNKNNKINDNKINIYTVGSNLASLGKITSITDGMGNKSEIQYAVSTDPSVYTCDKSKSSYPVNCYTLPLSVVKQIKSDNGSVQTTNYKYEDLMIHIGGRGLLGFNRTYSNNTTLGTEQTTEVTDWDKSRWLPKKVRSTSKVGTETSVSNSEYTFAPVHGNYFAYVSKSIATDLDGNSVSTITQYIDSIGVIKDQTVYNDDEQMYKKTSYEDYVKKGGMYLPAKMIMEQKHCDFSTSYSSTTSYVYDDLGQIIKQTINDETEMALATEYTYDSRGNVTSTKSLVAGDKEIVSYNEYDPSGRFVTKSFTLPASSVNTYTYDIWGNVLTETDETNASNHLTIKHKYDGWGREIETIDAAGIKTQYSIAWDSSNNKKYHTVEKADNVPSVTIWYDKAGRKVEQSSLGQKGVSITKTWTYNDKGQVFQKGNHTGNLHIVDTYTYDNRGRLVRETSNTGKSASYSYGNRSVTTTIGNRTYTKTSDAWGNPIKSVDPDGTTVSYSYHSNGQPRTVKSGGSTVSITYDVAGNKISLNDPDAGRMTYTYAPDGTLLSQKDGRGIETVNTYDELGRIIESKTGDKTISYEYGELGNSVMQLKKQKLDRNTIEYEYDSLGRVKTEIRTISNHGTLEFHYRYNDKDQLIETVYPGGLTVGYRYDANGFKTQTLANGQVVNERTVYDGKVSKSLFMGSLITTHTRNDNGTLFRDTIAKGKEIIESYIANYDILTNNLLSRQRTDNLEETFSYDNQDRLTRVMRGNEVVMSMDYAANGNITAKSDIGDYTYGSSTNKPHAVKSISNQPAPFPSSLLNTMYNAWSKIETISLNKYNGNALSMDIVYGPDQERWYSEYTAENGSVRETVYAGNYEKVTENGVTREFYYLDGNVIVVKQNGVFTPYLAFKDNLGSFLSIMDKDGYSVFDAEYDVWGKQEVYLNDIGFQRGYTGHEMLDEFDIINMNGRLYDPTIARFLSPDNYVQAPDNSQSFNRYSYCLNNPLKYTDPSGEIFGIDDTFFAFAIYGIASSMMQTKAMGGSAKDVWKAGGISLLASVGTYGIGSGCTALAKLGMSTAGVELIRAGAHGLNSGLIASLQGNNFGKAFATGALSSGMGSFAQYSGWNSGAVLASTTAMGGVAAWSMGDSFLEGALRGFEIGMFNHIVHKEGDVTYAVTGPQDGGYSFGISIKDPNSQALSLGSMFGVMGSSIERNAKQYTEKNTAARWNYCKDMNNRYRRAHSTNSMYKHMNKYMPQAIKYGKGLGYISTGITVYGDAMDVYNTQRIGVGHVLDVTMAVLPFFGPVGTTISLVYVATDFVVYNICDQSISSMLNDSYSTGLGF